MNLHPDFEIDIGRDKSVLHHNHGINNLARACIQHSWPVIDLVELTGTAFSPNTSTRALASLESPPEWDDAWRLI